MSKVVIWDLDNCLADDLWRVPLIDWHLRGDERYARYGENCDQDTLHNLDKFEFMCKLGTPVVITGRTELLRAPTLRWTAQLGINPRNVLMRPLGVRTPAAQLKLNMLRQRFFSHQVVAAFDDLPDVVAAYRSFGIASTQLIINELHHYEEPKQLCGIR